MRNVVLLGTLMACSTACRAEGPQNGFLGESSGSVRIDGKERTFDGGALEIKSTDGDTLIVVTTSGWHFTCDWAEGMFSSKGGPNIDRQGTHWDLAWFESTPGQALLMESQQGIFGGGTGSAKAVNAEMELEVQGAGTLFTDRGDVWFETHRCPGEMPL